MACAGRRSSRSAPRRIWPPSAGTRPLITLKSVVLPAPFGPMRPVIEPSPTESVQPPSASTPPKRLVMLVTLRSSAVAGSPVARDHIRFPEARGVAQPGTAPALGGGGGRFTSGHPDHAF